MSDLDKFFSRIESNIGHPLSEEDKKNIEENFNKNNTSENKAYFFEKTKATKRTLKGELTSSTLGEVTDFFMDFFKIPNHLQHKVLDHPFFTINNNGVEGNFFDGYKDKNPSWHHADLIGVRNSYLEQYLGRDLTSDERANVRNEYFKEVDNLRKGLGARITERIDEMFNNPEATKSSTDRSAQKRFFEDALYGTAQKSTKTLDEMKQKPTQAASHALR